MPNRQRLNIVDIIDKTLEVLDDVCTVVIEPQSPLRGAANREVIAELRKALQELPTA